MSLELNNSSTEHTLTINKIVVENNNVYQVITQEKDIMSNKQLEHLLHMLITEQDYYPDPKGQKIFFTNKTNIKYMIDKSESIMIKEEKIYIGPLENI
tara:strand:- start:18 stop:311 length:294 start_codon:yes stop_codon:yes gene_type:complete